VGDDLSARLPIILALPLTAASGCAYPVTDARATHAGRGEDLMSFRVRFALAGVAALALTACGPTATEADDGDGGTGWGADATWGGGEGGPIDQPPPDNCSEAAKLVYVVADDGHMLSFSPRTSPPTVVDLGALSQCPVQSGDSPFSMGIDRDAIAWVLSNAGTLYRIDIRNGLDCTNAGMTPNQQGFTLFGMGFVTNDVGSTLDTLYVAGGEGPGSGTPATLGTVSFPDLTVHPLQPLSGWPELTGNANAELWGFFPDTTPPKIAKINKATGAEDPNFPLDALQGSPTAWAFAFWGGDFWIFLQKDLENETTVYHVDGTNGTIVEQWLTSQLGGGSAHSIVGAGVSTCAPVVID
jgi:hypothetical protein